MFSNKEINADREICLGLAQLIAPKDTGNLAYNAIKDEPTHFGFRIRFSLADAFYIYFLEEGTRNIQTHVGFIANQIYPTLSAYLYSRWESDNEKSVKSFERASRIGSFDDVSDESARDIRHKASLSQDVEAIAAKNNWRHDPNIETEKDIKKISAYYSRFY